MLTHLLALLTFAAPITELHIDGSNAAALDKLEEYPALTRLTISCLEELKELPASVGTLKQLRELIIDNGNGCQMNPLLPESLGDLTALQTLRLYGAQDPGRPGRAPPGPRHPFPRAMSRLVKLESLDLGRNSLTEVPTFVKDLRQLQALSLQWNRLTVLPQFLSELQQLETLDLSFNRLTDLPDALGKLPRLKVVKLANNCALTTMPGPQEALRRRFPGVKFDFSNPDGCQD
jgi:Leucine-rich repeat (LRR) protein